MNTQKSQVTFNFALKVPAADVEAVEKVLANHAAWMKSTHSLEAVDGKVHLVDYHVSKGLELKNMMDPSEGDTGFVLYSLNETYAQPDGTDQHMVHAQKWEGLPEFFGTMTKYSEVKFAGKLIHTL
jgi:hypothetical protein